MWNLYSDADPNAIFPLTNQRLLSSIIFLSSLPLSLTQPPNSSTLIPDFGLIDTFIVDSMTIPTIFLFFKKENNVLLLFHFL